MYLYGAGGHAKVIIDILENNGIAIGGLFDDDPSVSEFCGYPVVAPAHIRGPLIVSIGDNRTRQRIVGEIESKIEFGKVADPSAIVSHRSTFGEGTVVRQGAIVQADSHIGRHTIVSTSVIVAHDCIIGDFAHISPGVNLCGNVSVGRGTWIGAGSVVIPGVKIGAWSVVGAGSVVTKDIADGVLAYGNPCKVIKQI